MKRIFVLVLSLVLAFSLMTVVAFASETDEPTSFSVDVVDKEGSYSNFIEGSYDVKLYRHGVLRAEIGTLSLYRGSSFSDYVSLISPPNYKIEIRILVDENNVPILRCYVNDVDHVYATDEYVLTFDPVPPKPATDSIFGVFSGIGAWISSALMNFATIFWSDGHLTLIGVLAVSGLAVSVIFFLFGLIRRFLNFG